MPKSEKISFYSMLVAIIPGEFIIEIISNGTSNFICLVELLILHEQFIAELQLTSRRNVIRVSFKVNSIVS